MITALISLVALIVSVFAFFITSERFRLDLYNKRFDVYIRTVKFYQALTNREEPIQDSTFELLRNDFVIASRESKFLFEPESGVHDLLVRLLKASSTITDLQALRMEFPQEKTFERLQQITDARALWHSNIEPLEGMMAPYLDYHYTSAPLAFIGRIWTLAQKAGLRRSASGCRDK